jgi:hypothetical protein
MPLGDVEEQSGDCSEGAATIAASIDTERRANPSKRRSISSIAPISKLQAEEMRFLRRKTQNTSR